MKQKRCVILVENLPVPLDRHVWQQAKVLRDAGWRVSVICPHGNSYPTGHERLEGIDVFRHSLPTEGNSFWGHILEYAGALFHQGRLLARIAVTGGVDVIHACNPPDFLFVLALPFKPFGVKFVFDHHDLAPELYESLYGGGAMHRVLLLLERLSFGLADVVLSSNETFREIAVDRGHKAPEDVFVVHTIPDAPLLKRQSPDTAARAGRRLVLGYLGIIGRQDGLDHMLEAVRILRHERGHTDFQVVVVGDGPAHADIVVLAAQLGIADCVTFRGYLSGTDLVRQLSDFDIGVIPDPRNGFNDKLSMNKVFEYSALGIPIACYALTETVRQLGAAGAYAQTDDPAGLADAIETLMTDDALRATKGSEARAVAAEKFDWSREAASLLSAYARFSPPSV
jgi:glycosyltransferase involved in cell wall biosynthesis